MVSANTSESRKKRLVNLSFWTKLLIVSILITENVPISVAQNIVHFRVNMNELINEGIFVLEEGDSLYVLGSFNNWNGSGYGLTDADSDGLFDCEFKIDGEPDALHQFKYVIQKSDGRMLWEKNPNPDNPDYGNRLLKLNGNNQILEESNFDFDKYYLALAGKKVIFSIKEMQEDFIEFKEILQNEHCCLYDYTSKEEFVFLFKKQFDSINRPMEPHEFYKIFTPITAKIGCGHTAVWMPGGYWEIDPLNLFPLQFKLIDDYAVIIGSYNDSLQIPYGSIILEINGRKVEDIFNEMRANYSADAFNINFINSQIARRFSLIYARRFGFPEKYSITYALPGRKTSDKTELQPATNASVRAVVFSNFNHPDLDFEILEEKNTAILTVATFNYYDRVPYFRGYIDSCFTEIKRLGIENLILDVRSNDGGDPFCAAPLFAYLQKESVPYFSKPYGKYAELAEPLEIPDNHFNGNLITLMDGRCFSTNAHFCSLIKYHKIGVIVGTESGGTYTCNAGNNGIRKLKNSGIQLYFATSSYATAVEGMDKSKPIQPDYYINESYKEFLKGKDIYMQTAFQIIAGKSKIGLY